MTYVVRTEGGLMTMKISQYLAEDIFSNTKGTFRPYVPADGSAVKTAFEIAEDKVLIAGDTKLYLWEKTLLIPE